MNSQFAVQVSGLSVWFGAEYVLRNLTLDLPSNHVIAVIGPSGCGKSTFLKTLNRMNDLQDNHRLSGSVVIEGVNIADPHTDVVALRRKVGMVFQKSNPFPFSIYDNIAYGPRIHGIKERERLAEIVEESLSRVGLWDEVKDRLTSSALTLSGGQQQRLCLARALAVGPEIVLLDEPATALDPYATSLIEELIIELRTRYTVIMVTHNMQQAARVSDMTLFLHKGELVEFGPTRQLFTKPREQLTEQFITGRTR